MKHNLGISTVAIVCVLCTAVSGAYGASSVRSLGGSGTYTSASNAAAAADSNGSASSIRGGSVRVNPTSGVSGTSTTIEAGTTTSGRVATTPRLSIGHYLGGAISVSGGSSLRPTTPSGGTSGGGSTGGGVSGDDFAGLQGRVDQLERDYNDLQGVTDGLTDQIATKQDVLVPGNDGYIIIDDTTNEIFVDVDALQGALETVAGEDGREVELGSNDTHLLWRYVGEGNDKWRELIAKADITGPQGERGEKGEPGEAANLDAYSTTEQMNAAISAAIAGLATTYATKAELAGYATSDDLTRGLAAKANADDVYTKTEVDTKISEATSGIVGSEEIEQFKTDVANLKTTVGDENSGLVKGVNDLSGNVAALDAELETVSQLAGSAAATATAASNAAAQASTDAANALAGLANKEDKSNKKTTLTNSDTDYPSTSAVTAALAGKANVDDIPTTVAELTDASNYVTTTGLDSAIDSAITEKDFVTSADLATKADASDVDALGQRVTAAETDIGEINATIGSGELTTSDKTVLGAINELKTKTDDMPTDGNFAEMKNKIDEMEGKLDGKQDVANLVQVVSEADTTKYPSGAAVYKELETKANVSDLANYATTETVNQIEQNVTNVTQTVTQLGDTINNAETGLAAKVDDAVAAATEAKEAADAATSAVAGKQDALGYTAENDANKTDDMTVDAGSTTKYPTVHAVEAYVTNTVAEGVDINTDQIDDGAITKPKLHQNLQNEIDGKANTADLGALAKKSQITNADVADDAAIAKSKLALDVQTALDNAANAVAAPDGEKPANSILGTDGDGNPTWYEIVLE